MATGADVIAQAQSWVGTPYGWGQEIKGIAADCSALVQGVFSSLGVKLPRTSEAQALTGQAVPSLAAAQPGDLIFFNTEGIPNTHVGIYAGSGYMYDAAHSGTTVQLRSIAGYGPITAIRREVAAAPMTASTPGASASPPSATGPLLAAWAAYRAGFRGQSLLTAVAIAGAESGYNPNAVNNNPATGDYSVGLWQINYYGSLGPARTRQFGQPQSLVGVQGAEANANAAYALSGGGTNFSPWTTYTTGAYQANAASAAQGVQAVTGGDIGSTATLTSDITTGAQQTSDCIISLPSFGPIGGGCLLGSHQARGLLGGLLVIGGTILTLSGFAILTASLIGQPVAALAPGPVGTVARSIGSSTGRDRTRQRERPDREPPLSEQDIEDLNTEMTTKRQESEGPSEEERQFRRDTRAVRRAQGPRRAAA